MVWKTLIMMKLQTMELMSWIKIKKCSDSQIEVKFTEENVELSKRNDSIRKYKIFRNI